MTEYEDPSALPEGERMTPAELRVAREFLGLSTVQLAALLRVTDRTVRHWEEDKYPIPPGVAGELDRLERRAADLAARLAREMGAQPSPTLATYRTDADYREADPAGRLPASWHRAAAARARALLPGARVVYAEPVTVPLVPAFPVALFRQLLDVLHGTVIDAAAAQDPRAFLLGEIEDVLDDVTQQPAYPELLEAAQTWTVRQASGLLAAVLRYWEAARNGGDHAVGLRAAGYDGVSQPAAGESRPQVRR